MRGWIVTLIFGDAEAEDPGVELNGCIQFPRGSQDGCISSQSAVIDASPYRFCSALCDAAFPDLSFGGTADPIAEGDYVVGQWVGGGTQTGDAFDDMPIGSLPPGTGKSMRFTGTTVLKVENGQITEEIGLDDGVTVLRQLGLITET